MKTQRIDPEDYRCTWKGVSIRTFQNYPEHYDSLKKGRLFRCVGCSGFWSSCPYY